ncbi:MAG: hypothetical protein AMXMBFR31_03360 [Candidatus Desulfobacillus denitrificans]
MPNEFKLKSSVALMAALSAAFPLAGHAANAARVDFAAGDVKALSPDGRSRPLAKGAEIASGETIDTGSGRAQVRFSDGAQVSLAPQTQFRIDDYRFSGQADGSEKGFFSLLKGGLRTITGLVGRTNRENYRVTTTVATIGIRGTEFSVIYGNSINVTTGEGSNEVCNAAGCLILNSGETAYVPDANTRPVMSDKKAEIPPPPVQEGQLPGFVAGNDTSGNGGLFPALPSGPGYSVAGAGHYYSGGWLPTIDGPESYHLNGQSSSTFAHFDGSGALLRFDGAEGSYSITGVSAGAFSDGVIGWGRWASASEDDFGSSYTYQDLHYVVGVPTPLADMSSLQIADMVGTYSLIGFTFPTAYNSSTGVTTVGTQPISGSMTAKFGDYQVMGTLNVPMSGITFVNSWSGGISGSAFYGSGSASGGTCGSGCSSDIQGFFAGANAARAGLVYQIEGTNFGTISGAAAFRQTGLAACVGSGC